jgi:hypothetical protein
MCDLFRCYLASSGSRDSSVGIEMDYGLDGWGSITDRGKTFLFSTASRPALGATKPPTQWVPEALSLGVKRPERESDHSPPSSAEIKNSGVTALFPMSSWHSA